MLVYVESNFILELALEQTDAASTQTILTLAEEGKITLAFPIFTLIEPFWTIQHRGRERQTLYESLQKQLQYFQRSRAHSTLVTNLKPLLDEMLEIEKQEMGLFEITLGRLLTVGIPIEINQQVFEEAMRYRKHYGFTPQDSIMYAAVLYDLQRREGEEAKCFISRNVKDFSDPEIKAELRAYKCRYIVEFRDGLSYIQSVVEG